MADTPTAAAPSLDALDAVADRACEPPTGASRAKQLRWVAGELRTALERGALPPAAAGTLAALLAPATLDAYLTAAEQGLLRRRPAARPDHASPASMHVRENCLRILATRAGIPLTLPDRDRPAVTLRETVAARPRSILLGHLENATRPGQDDARTRILAVVATVLDTGCRAGELCALRTADVDLHRGTLRLTRLPQHRDPRTPPATETVPLSPTTRAALRNWLTARERLTLRDATEPPGPDNETTGALWVSIAPSGHPRPGLPLHFRGLARAYARAVHDLNTDMAGQPGWHPLPRRMEPLRRAVRPRPDDTAGAAALRHADADADSDGDGNGDLPKRAGRQRS
ncbi:site-specific integrase [Kitasatospora cineracea]|uniref:Phage integrase family protein n=1 Tax=Kitasatospora cineracea TaxID=88074 RepID=A0A3N4SIS6_9ACTN|nr:tyrosine-type recombinase/integrase [Kitasatospora cineracea]RPE36404.1 phage integrase family protein [Kitasatospora cineracea]